MFVLAGYHSFNMLMWQVMCVCLYSQLVMAGRLNHVYTSCFQIACSTPASDPRKLSESGNFDPSAWMSQTAYFAPPSSTGDKVTHEAVTAEKVALSVLTSASAWSLSCPNLQSKLKLTRRCSQSRVIGPGHFQHYEKMERPSADLLSSQGHDVECRMCCICYCALRRITAHPAACCAEVRCVMLRSAVSTLDYVFVEINQIIWLYAMKAEIPPDALASM